MPASTTPRVTLIAALASDRGIGLKNQLLWHLPEDMAHFRRQTQGCPVIMGRKTWDSLPVRFRPLPGRLNLVVTRDSGWHSEGATVAHSLDQAVALARATRPPRVFVIGGAQLYAQALALADQLLLTEIDADLPGDTFFPAWRREDFTEVRRESGTSAGATALTYAFAEYHRTA